MKNKHFCSDALCGKEIQKHSGYIRVGADYYCSQTCWENFLTINRDFNDAADPFKPRKHTTKKKWYEI